LNNRTCAERHNNGNLIITDSFAIRLHKATISLQLVNRRSN